MTYDNIKRHSENNTQSRLGKYVIALSVWSKCGFLSAADKISLISRMVSLLSSESIMLWTFQAFGPFEETVSMKTINDFQINITVTSIKINLPQRRWKSK